MHWDCYCSSKKYSIIHVSNNAINIFNRVRPPQSISLSVVDLVFSYHFSFDHLSYSWTTLIFMSIFRWRRKMLRVEWRRTTLSRPTRTLQVPNSISAAESIHYRKVPTSISAAQSIHYRYLLQYMPPNLCISGTYFNICRPNPHNTPLTSIFRTYLYTNYFV